MKIKTTFKMPFKRRRKEKTNYAKRLAFVKSGKTRLVVRRSNKALLIQFIQYEEKGDKTKYSLHSSTLKKIFKFPAKCNTPTAYLAGLYAGKQAQQKGIKNAIADINTTPSRGAVVFAVLKGVLDSGVDIQLDTSEKGKIINERIEGSHLNIKEEFERVRHQILSQ